MNTPTSSSDESSDEEPAELRIEPEIRPRPATRPSFTAGLLPDTCSICGGIGYVVPDLPLTHPDFGKAVPCRCREQERLDRRLRALQSINNMSAIRRFTFANFIPEPSHINPAQAFNLHRALDNCSYYAEAPEGWLLLMGAYGCGKTHLAAAIANARVDAGEPALFIVVPDLLDHLRAAFAPQSDVSYDNLFEQLRTTPLLILDDLGAHSSTAWAQEKLFQLLNYRYVARLNTVITTNQRLEEMDPRIRSRLNDPSLVKHYHITAPDFRAGKTLQPSQLSTLRLHLDQTFEKFSWRREDIAGDERLNLKEINTVCATYASEPKGWIVLAGASGSGKTHLAAAIANHVANHTQTEVMFVVVPDLLDHLRAAYSPQSTVPYDRRFDEVKNAPLLVLDDLGTESATPWAREKLFQLLNHRYNALLPTVVTTSATPDEIEPWLRTRMFDIDRCQFCAIKAPAFRRSRTDAQGSAKAKSKAKQAANRPDDGRETW
jgi:DNA replication protein DnaC